MPELSLHCPHCDTEKVGFSFGGLHSRIRSARSLRGMRQIWTTLFACNRCSEGVVVKLESDFSSERQADALLQVRDDPRQHGFKIVGVYPGASKADAPEHVPEGIARDFREAADCLRRTSFSAAGMMFRKTLERATLELSEDQEAMRSKNLFDRIEALARQGALAPAMKDLAHVIRLEGNDAAHELEDLDEPGARQLAEFAELFLLYCFTLPERIRRARGEASPA